MSAYIDFRAISRYRKSWTSARTTNVLTTATSSCIFSLFDLLLPLFFERCVCVCLFLSFLMLRIYYYFFQTNCLIHTHISIRVVRPKRKKKETGDENEKAAHKRFKISLVLTAAYKNSLAKNQQTIHWFEFFFLASLFGSFHSVVVLRDRHLRYTYETVLYNYVSVFFFSSLVQFISVAPIAL